MEGYTATHNSWEPRTILMEDVSDLVKQYEQDD